MAASRAKSGKSRLSLVLLPTPGQHRDLELRCGPLRHLPDSYYLALDHAIDRRQEGRTKVRRVLVALLRGVRQLVKRANAPTVVLFPYDFSDQYTGLLELAIDARDQVTIRRVFSRLESWQLVVSKAWRLPAEAWGELAPWPGEEEELPLLVLPRSEVLERLEASELVAARKKRAV